jgi:fumarate reductase flavoprotein subunit
MLYTMSNQAIAQDIPVHERMEALSLIHDGQRCYGAIVRNLMTGELLAYIAKSTCIATGGFRRL